MFSQHFAHVDEVTLVKRRPGLGAAGGLLYTKHVFCAIQLSNRSQAWRGRGGAWRGVARRGRAVRGGVEAGRGPRGRRAAEWEIGALLAGGPSGRVPARCHLGSHIGRRLARLARLALHCAGHNGGNRMRQVPGFLPVSLPPPWAGLADDVGPRPACVARMALRLLADCLPVLPRAHPPAVGLCDQRHAGTRFGAIHRPRDPCGRPLGRDWAARG